MNDPSLLDEFLRPVLEVAVALARRVAQDDGPTAVPSRLRPFVQFSKLPAKALTAARLAVEDDEEFRGRVAEAVDEASVDRGPWLWVSRPQGWRDDLDAEWEAWHESRAAAAEEAAERSTAKLLDRANEAITRLERRVSQLESILSTTEDELSRARAEGATASSERDQAAADVARLTAERVEAVRQLKEAERRLAERTEDLRAARADLAVLAETEPADGEGPSALDPEILAVVGGLLRRTDDLRSDVEKVAALVGVEREAARSGGAPPLKRRPRRLGRGLDEDSTAAAEVLLDLDGVVVLVDAYNLTMTVWPGLSASEQRRFLQRGLESVAGRSGAEIHVVYDGDAEGATPSRSVGSSLRIRFTPADVEADDEILDLIETIPVSRPVVVVSDDRRVRRGSRARGANVVGSRQFQPLVLR